MSVAVVTGSSGLIGSESARFFHAQGMDVVGIDNNMRQYYFGDGASTAWNTGQLQRNLPRFTHCNMDIRNHDAVQKLFGDLGARIEIVIHTAAQPSHDWAAKEPFTDFSVNAGGTLEMLEATRTHCPNAVFILTSTNKVYGDTPNALPLVEGPTRWELDPAHRFSAHGIDETMSIDQSTHSLFGVSKIAADVMTQEYGRYFGLKTGVFRGGCLTGPAHSAAELHGFLAYLVQCALTGKPYTIYGYKGKQVRDNIHASDLISAFWNFFQNPRPGTVYNMGGSRHSNCSMLEAIQRIEALSGKTLNHTYSDQARSGDHIWWISDVRRFQTDYPNWLYRYDLDTILSEMIAETRVRTVRA